MRYILSLISLVLIGTLALQFSSVSAVTVTGTISGEKRVITASPKVQLLKLKQALVVAKKKVALLKSQIAVLKKQIELKVKRGLITKSLDFRMESLMEQLNKAEQTASEIQKKIEETGSGVINKIG